MFGDNPTRKQSHLPDGSLVIEEMFRTIQGEGPRAGQGAIFVRLAGCNLNCYFCDTQFESPFRSKEEQIRNTFGPQKIVEEIFALIGVTDISLVVLTGGEPLRQNVAPLVRQLTSLGVTVQVETAGTLWHPDFDHLDWEIVVSPKTGSVRKEVEERATAYKYIITVLDKDTADHLPVMSSQVAGKASPPARPPRRLAPEQIFLQPCDYPDNPGKSKAALVIAARHAINGGHRLSLQLHKIANLP